jgi:transposase InsO family protein
MLSVLYSVIRLLVDVVTTMRRDQAELAAEVLTLRRQVQVLERQIKRVHWTPGDRMVMAAVARLLPNSAWKGLLVKPETVLGWHRDLVRRKWASYRGRPCRGRPPLSDEVRALIQRLATENPSWGYFRIKGELMKLGHKVAATTIRSVLIRARIPPSGKRSGLSWKKFLAAHAQTLIATDMFTVDTVLFKRLHVLFFLHLASCRIMAATATSEPGEQWVTQQARNLSMKLVDEDISLTVVIHDHDSKYPKKFDVVFEADGARVILTPLMAPLANSFAGRWVGSIRRECLDWMLIASERHLATVLREYCAHYNEERPHRSLALVPPNGAAEPLRQQTTHIM